MDTKLKDENQPFFLEKATLTLVQLLYEPGREVLMVSVLRTKMGSVWK